MTTFKAQILLGHKGAAVEVPFDPAELWHVSEEQLWPGRRGHNVKGTLNGISFESVIVRRSKKSFMLVDEDVQRKAAVSIGDRVDVSVEPRESVAHQ